jgi:Flp pilus assembly protein TadG
MRKRTRDRRQGGNAVLEFAIAFPLLWACFAGLFQMGYTFYVYNALMTSVANAAALGAKMNYDLSQTDRFNAALKNMVVYGNTTTGNTPIVAGLSTANVSVSVNAQASIPTAVTVSIQNYSIDAVFTRFTFSGKPRATMPYMGEIGCTGC